MVPKKVSHNSYHLSFPFDVCFLTHELLLSLMFWESLFSSFPDMVNSIWHKMLTFSLFVRYMVKAFLTTTFSFYKNHDFFESYFQDVAQIGNDPHSFSRIGLQVLEIFAWAKSAHYVFLYVHPPPSYWHELLWCDIFMLFNCDSVTNLEIGMITMCIPYIYSVFYKKIYTNPIHRQFEQIIRYGNTRFLFFSKFPIQKWLLKVANYYKSANTAYCEYQFE